MKVDGNLDAIALNDLINELRNAGAEAIAVDEIRVTRSFGGVRAARARARRGARSGSRFTLRAIGSPEDSSATMERPGGIISQLELFINATIVIRQSEIGCATQPT